MAPNLNGRKVAIVIPLYNDAENIERAIESALNQALPADYALEVIVVDDCSTDDGFRRAERMMRHDDRLTVLRQDVNQGPSAARNRALALSDAAWFTPLDSDDMILPDRTSKLLKIAQDHDLDWVADNLLISMEDSPTQVDRTLWPEKPDGPVELTAAFFVNRSYDVETPRSELGFIKPLINREKAATGLEPYRNDLRFGEDFELYTRLLLNGTRAWLVDACGYYLIQRAGSASHSQSGRDHRRLAKISRAMSKRRDISVEARQALEHHRAYSEKEAAVWAVMDGVRERNPRLLLSAFSYSVPASLHVIGQVSRSALGKLKPK